MVSYGWLRFLGVVWDFMWLVWLRVSPCGVLWVVCVCKWGLCVCVLGVFCWTRRGPVYRAGPNRAQFSDPHIPEPPLIVSVCETLHHISQFSISLSLSRAFQHLIHPPLSLSRAPQPHIHPPLSPFLCLSIFRTPSNHVFQSFEFDTVLLTGTHYEQYALKASLEITHIITNT